MCYNNSCLWFNSYLGLGGLTLTDKIFQHFKNSSDEQNKMSRFAAIKVYYLLL